MPPRTVSRAPSFRLELLEDRLAPAVVGYYDMSLGQGNSNQVYPIQQAGHTPVSLTDLTAANLSGVDVLFVQNPSNEGYGAEYLSRLGPIADFVASGKVLILHDRWVETAESALPGAAGFDIRRDFADYNNIELLATAGSLPITGPGGTLTNVSLDAGNSSTHGWALSSSLPAGARRLLSTGDPAHVVAFNYRHGAGSVYYSSIPLDYQLQFFSPFTTAYAVNVVAYGVTLLNAPPSAQDGSAATDEDAAVEGQLSAADPNGDALTFEIVQQPAHGTLILLDAATGAYRYTPDANYNGPDAFTFRTRDAGPQPSNVAAVSLTVRPVNDAPAVDAGADRLADEGSQVEFTAVGDDVEGDAITYTWDFGDGATATGATASHLYTDNGVYTVTVTADDGNGGQTTDTLVLSVENVVPQEVTVGPDRSVTVGTPASFTGAFSDPGSADTHTLAWRVIDASGAVVGEGAGATFTFSPPRVGSFTVTLTVTDDDGGAASDSLVLSATPAPGGTATIAGPATGVRGQKRDFTASWTGLTGTVTGEWKVFDARGHTVARGRGTSFRFTAAREGDYRVEVVLRDAAGTTATASRALRVNVVELQPDPIDPTKLALAVGGTNGRDVVVFTAGRPRGTVEVFLGFRSLGTFAPTGRLLAFGQAGNDSLVIDPRVTAPAVLKGGSGDDLLIGGSGADILQGGRGDDVIFGGAGRDLLIGGKGRDFLRGNAGDDILVAGYTKYGGNLAALDALLSEWNSSRDFTTRVGNVTGRSPTPDRLNGSVFLVHKGKGQTVFGWDNDDLKGEGGKDLLIGEP